MSVGTEGGQTPDTRGAWIVETLIVALVLVLVGKHMGVATSLWVCLVALAFAGAIVFAAYAVGNRLANKR